MANYDIAEHWEDLSPGQRAHVINLASDEQLNKWASDPDCNQKFLCATALAKAELRGGGADSAKSGVSGWTSAMSEATSTSARQADRLFVPSLDVSADGRHIANAVESSGRRIVKHLWIIFVVLPFVLAILYEIIK